MPYNSFELADKTFVTYLDKLFALSVDDLKHMINEMHSEMQSGLSGYASSLPMIPSFVSIPEGNEKGHFLALDLGGTNFRVVKVVLDGKGGASVTASSKYVLKKKDIQGTGEDLFKFIALCIKEFISENNIEENEIIDLGFTFSFGVEQTNIAAGTLIGWSKGFTATGVVGEDVVVCLNEALRKNGIFNIRVAALVNDTVGTLVAKNYTDKTCDMGVILGTGTNACYSESMGNITKWRGVRHNKSMIINMEWGIFDKLPLTYYDKFLDKNTANPNDHILEKMTSGLYLGELMRLVLRDMSARGIYFNEKDTLGFIRIGSFKTEYMSRIVEDSSLNLLDVEQFMKEYGFVSITKETKEVMKEISLIIAGRSAKLAGTAIGAVIAWKDPELREKHTVGIDGSLFEKFPGYADMMYKVLNVLFGSKAEMIKLDIAKDGSGKGAAIIAAIASKMERK